MSKFSLGFLFSVMALLCGCSKVGSDSASSAPVSLESPQLALTLELVNNQHQGKQQSLSNLTLVNKGSETLPATGWKLFYNGGYFRLADTTVAVTKRYNGDLNYMAPGSAFKALQPGDSTTIEVMAGAVQNVSSFPSGFYIVSDQNPEKGFPVALKTIPGQHFAAATQQLSAKIFEKNEQIKDIPMDKLVKVFPTPVSYKEQGEAFELNNTTAIVADAAFSGEAAGLATSLGQITGSKPAVQSQASGKAIFLRKKEGMGAEGYTLSVNANRIEITATNPAGAFYGIQSLKTLLPPEAYANPAATVRITGVEVKDAPRFGYRAFMMDAARNFQSKAEVLKVLDVMALYKLNKFHFHFSDDEGWRLEIPSLPELAKVGGSRMHTMSGSSGILPSYGSGPTAGSAPGSGYISKAEFVEILKYAKDRHIEVIPEIETPGHARAAIKAMDARYQRLMDEGKKAEAERYLLRDLSDKSQYRSVQGWNDNVMDVSLASTYNFLETVVDDIRSMYKEAGAPLNTVHFGGDEVPPGVWEKSPSVQQLISQNANVKNADDLWYYYFGKVNQMLKARDLYLSGWEEIGLKKVEQNGQVTWVPNEQFAKDNFHVNVWKNSPGSGAEDLAYRMANAGYKVILTGVTHLYLDLAYNPSFDEPGQNWGGYVDIDKPFYLIPFDYLKNLKEDDNGNPLDPSVIKSHEKLTAAGKANIVGIEAPLWSETNKSPEDFEYKMLPKLLAVAERAWAKDPQWATEPDAAKSESLYTQAWSEFLNVVGKRELPRLSHYAGGYNYRIPTAGAKIENGMLRANVQFPNFTIRYTTDNSEPTASSPVYKGPLQAEGTTKLKVFNQAGRAGNTVAIKREEQAAK